MVSIAAMAIILPAIINTMMTGLYNLTGKYAAIVGADYGYKANNNLETINTKLIEHWKAGGLVTISWHADNPYVEGYNCR